MEWRYSYDYLSANASATRKRSTAGVVCPLLQAMRYLTESRHIADSFGRSRSNAGPMKGRG
jgi:hypothetical protein